MCCSVLCSQTSRTEICVSLGRFESRFQTCTLCVPHSQLRLCRPHSYWSHRRPGSCQYTSCSHIGTSPENLDRPPRAYRRLQTRQCRLCNQAQSHRLSSRGHICGLRRGIGLARRPNARTDLDLRHCRPHSPLDHRTSTARTHIAPQKTRVCCR